MAPDRYPPMRWSTGTWRALVWESGAALLEPSLALDAAERIWRAVDRDPRLSTFLEELGVASGRGLLDLPGFAIALAEGNGAHVAIRGAVTLTVESDEPTETFTGDGVITWIERQLRIAHALTISAEGPPDEHQSLPIGRGIVLAGGILMGQQAPALVPALPALASPALDVILGVEPGPLPASPPAMPPPRAAEPPPADQEPAADESEVAPEPPDDEAGSAQQPITRLADDVETLAEDDPASLAAPAPVQRPVDDPAEASTASEAWPVERATEDPSGGSGRYASLWSDHSIAVSVEEAALRDQELGTLGSEFISAVPKSLRAGPAGDARRDDPAEAEPRVQTPEVSEGLHDGHTVLGDGTDLIAIDSSTNDEALVLSAHCDRGHPNPPQRTSCFVCGASVSGRASRVPRPTLGRIRVSSGEIIELAGPVVAGRSPSARASRSHGMARLLALPHPHISGSHLEIRIEGWTVLAQDLRSTNGTYLRRQEQPPVRLPETAMPLIDGDVLDLGHGVFLYLERLP